MRTQLLAPGIWVIATVGVLLGGAPDCHALTFHLTYDGTTASAPAGFFTAFQAAIDFFQANYGDPITINLGVGWGKINGRNLSPGNLGQSSTFQSSFFNYAQIRNAMVKDAKSGEDAIAIASLPAADPTGGASFVMANAQAKVLGLLAAKAPGTDGFVGFSSNAVFNFDPINRAVAGEYDFFALACHEITEVMGRYGLGQNGASSGRYSPIDLFRFSSAGVLDLAPANGSYFSIDGGHAVINTFNGTSGGDLSDWLGETFDSFNHSLSLGRKLEISEGDLIVMDVIGYDRILAAPSLMISSPAADSLLISWWSPSSSFSLQTNSDLTTTNWLPANVTISLANGTNYSATINPLPIGHLFFRLKR